MAEGPDYNKPLPHLQAEWESCTRCELGQRRLEMGGAFVFGEGALGRIMLIGEGPGQDEEKEGRPFVGRSGGILRKALKMLGLEEHVYIANCVKCRSCAQAYDNEGQPRFTTKGLPRIEDKPPPPVCIQKCLPLLHEQIYLVDPILIVALGGVAAQTLLGRPVSITTECDITEVARIPGAGSVAQLTDKKKQWLHKVRGQWVQPTVQNTVEYLCMPCLHPAYVARFLHDRRSNSPRMKFLTTLERARRTYELYMREVYGQELRFEPASFEEYIDDE